MKKSIVMVMLISILAVFSFTGCSAEKSVVLSGTGKSHGGDIKVDVTLKGDKIAEVKLVEINDSPGISEKAAEKVIAQIVKKNSVEGIDAVAGASETSKGVIDAVKDALSKK